MLKPSILRCSGQPHVPLNQSKPIEMVQFKLSLTYTYFEGCTATRMTNQYQSADTIVKLPYDTAVHLLHSLPLVALHAATD